MTERLGLPWHGLHQGVDPDFVGQEQHTPGVEVLSGVYKHADNIVCTRSRLMKHPTRSSVITPTAAETALGYTWQDYLLICGQTNVIGNTPLGDGRWLYVDGNDNVWLMRCEAVPSATVNNKITLNFYVDGLFGVFYCLDTNPYSLRNKLIASHDIFIRTGHTIGNTGQYDADVDNTLTFNGGVSRTMEWNSDGSDCIMTVTHPQEKSAAGYRLFFYLDSAYASSLIFDYDARDGGDDAVPGWLTNIVRWSVTGNGLMNSDLNLLGDGIEITITRDDQYSFEDSADPDFEGPAGYTSGGKTFWFNISPIQSQIQTEEWNWIGRYFYDDNDDLIECRLKVDVNKDMGATTTGVHTYTYTASIILDDGSTETSLGSYTATAQDSTFPYDDVDLYRPRFHFDRCGGGGFCGLIAKDPWHPSLPGTIPGTDEMAVYYIGTWDTPVTVNGLADTTRWHKVSDDTYYAGNAYPWPSYYNRAAWQPVDKELYWTKQFDVGVFRGYDPVPCYV